MLPLAKRQKTTSTSSKERFKEPTVPRSNPPLNNSFVRSAKDNIKKGGLQGTVGSLKRSLSMDVFLQEYKTRSYVDASMVDAYMTSRTPTQRAALQHAYEMAVDEGKHPSIPTIVTFSLCRTLGFQVFAKPYCAARCIQRHVRGYLSRHGRRFKMHVSTT